MTITDIQHAIQVAAGPVPITRDTYAAIADRALLTLDATKLDAATAHTLHMQSMRINTSDGWLDIACHRVAMKLRKAVGHE